MSLLHTFKRLAQNWGYGLVQRLKQKKCRVCKTLFTPRTSTQIVCGYEHAIAYAALQKTKALNQDIRKRKSELKTKRDWIKETQIEFNRYIRIRDRDAGCISCGVSLQPTGRGRTGGDFDCGHYRSIGSSPHLRFVITNAHGQCKKCNRYLSGNVVGYRLGLLRKIGLAELEALEADNTPKHYTIDDLKALKLFYRNRWKELEHEQPRTSKLR